LSCGPRSECADRSKQAEMDWKGETNMQLSELLDKIISDEVYKGVKIKCKIHHNFSALPKDTLEKIATDGKFSDECKEALTKHLQQKCYRDLEVIEIDPSSNSLEIEYTAYYIGSKNYPEIHLKTLLIYYDNRGMDVRDPVIFDKIVEEVRRDLGDKYRDCKEKRLNHFATLFKRALIQNLAGSNS
jgi:hypothetical protein